jgi:curved DNA-binding protein CbpA
MPPESPEQVDLEPDRQKYILEVYGQLDSLTHYELLRVSRNADKKTIKRAYFDLMGLIHPDRYFGKKLGSFKPKMERIFIQATRASETLLSVEARARYDASLEAARGNPSAEPRKAPVDPRLEARQKAAAELLKARYEQSKAKLKGLVETAERARRNADYVRAVSTYKEALALTPGDAVLAATLKDVEEEGKAKMCESYSKQAEMFERLGRFSDAADSWKLVVAARPSDAAAQRRLAEALARAARRS